MGEIIEPDGYRPVRPEKLCSAIGKIFRELRLEVKGVSVGGWQTSYDDDVSYNVVTKKPEWLEPAPAQRQITSILSMR